MMEIFRLTDRSGRLSTIASSVLSRLTFAIGVCLFAGSVGAVHGPGGRVKQEELKKPYRPDMRKAAPEAGSSELVAVGRLASAIRDNVAVACGATDVRHQVERCKAAANLGSGFNAAEIKLMLSFMDEKFDKQSEYGSLEFNAMKNDVSWALLHQDRPVESYCNALVAMYHDPLHDYVWRDYCIQHMALYCARIRETDGESGPAVLYGVLSSLSDAVKQVGMPFCGTALVGMKNLSGQDGMCGDIDVSDMALKVAENPGACNSARASALQIAAELKAEGILEIARDIARNGKDALLRMSAVNVLGKAGAAEDLPLLENLSEHRDSRISLAARRAVKLLRLRTGTTLMD